MALRSIFLSHVPLQVRERWKPEDEKYKRLAAELVSIRVRDLQTEVREELETHAALKLTALRKTGGGERKDAKDLRKRLVKSERRLAKLAAGLKKWASLLDGAGWLARLDVKELLRTGDVPWR